MEGLRKKTFFRTRKLELFLKKPCSPTKRSSRPQFNQAVNCLIRLFPSRKCALSSPGGSMNPKVPSRTFTFRRKSIHSHSVWLVRPSTRDWPSCSPEEKPLKLTLNDLILKASRGNHQMGSGDQYLMGKRSHSLSWKRPLGIRCRR